MRYRQWQSEARSSFCGKKKKDVWGQPDIKERCEISMQLRCLNGNAAQAPQVSDKLMGRGLRGFGQEDKNGKRNYKMGLLERKETAKIKSTEEIRRCVCAWMHTQV